MELFLTIPSSPCSDNGIIEFFLRDPKRYFPIKPSPAIDKIVRNRRLVIFIANPSVPELSRNYD
jgi:hypothetical protein